MKNEVSDIHAHVAPGVDDGASDLHMSVELLRNAYAQGVRNIICTSHNYGIGRQYFFKLELLKERLKKTI